MAKKNEIMPNESGLFNEINALIEQSRIQIVSQANSFLTLLFWQVGKRINEFVLEHKRAEYGKQVVVTLSRKLVTENGLNFEEKNLWRMLQFAEIFPDIEKIVTLPRHLSWSHFLTLLPLKTEEQRLLYAHQVTQEHLIVRYLSQSKLFRTALKKYEL